MCKSWGLIRSAFTDTQKRNKYANIRRKKAGMTSLLKPRLQQSSIKTECPHLLRELKQHRLLQIGRESS